MTQHLHDLEGIFIMHVSILQELQWELKRIANRVLIEIEVNSNFQD